MSYKMRTAISVPPAHPAPTAVWIPCSCGRYGVLRDFGKYPLLHSLKKCTDPVPPPIPDKPPSLPSIEVPLGPQGRCQCGIFVRRFSKKTGEEMALRPGHKFRPDFCDPKAVAAYRKKRDEYQKVAADRRKNLQPAPSRFTEEEKERLWAGRTPTLEQQEAWIAESRSHQRVPTGQAISPFGDIIIHCKLPYVDESPPHEWEYFPNYWPMPNGKPEKEPSPKKKQARR